MWEQRIAEIERTFDLVTVCCKVENDYRRNYVEIGARSFFHSETTGKIFRFLRRKSKKQERATWTFLSFLVRDDKPWKENDAELNSRFEKCQRLMGTSDVYHFLSINYENSLINWIFLFSPLSLPHLTSSPPPSEDADTPKVYRQIY